MKFGGNLEDEEDFLILPPDSFHSIISPYILSVIRCSH